MKTRFLLISAVGIAVFVVALAIFYLGEQRNNLPENDILCSTDILVQTTQKIDREIFAKIILEKITSLDSRFDIPDRYLLLTDMQDGKIRISLDGLWSEENDGTRLIESLEKLEFVESVLEQEGNKLLLECQ